MTVIGFENVAEIAVKRELACQLKDVAYLNMELNVFKTEVLDKSLGRSVTVWFEMQCQRSSFWDLMPVTIVYRDKQLTLGDICHRTAKFFNQSIERFYKRYYRLGELYDY